VLNLVADGLGYGIRVPAYYGWHLACRWKATWRLGPLRIAGKRAMNARLTLRRGESMRERF